MSLSPHAGKPVDPLRVVDIPRLITAYYAEYPDPSIASQRVAFGTSGHRGSAFQVAFNEAHILAITQAICMYRAKQRITGPLFIGMDTHALSTPALSSALEVLAANGVEVMLSQDDEYTPTPVISHAIITHNRRRRKGLADGIVITPSHNPPADGGFKYNPPHGGPAGKEITDWIQSVANRFLEKRLRGVRRITPAAALRLATTHRHDYRSAYVADLGNVIDMDVIRGANDPMGVDPLGGAGVHYWSHIASYHRIALKVISEEVDPTFRFMTMDWDGQIRMDPSSPYAMQRLLGLKDRFTVSCACDTDHDRHGIVTRTSGLLPPNHYLAVAIQYLFTNRPQWKPGAAVGKTVVSSRMIDLVAQQLGRALCEVPVGFKWFVEGLSEGSLGFGGEESAGASFLRRDGTVWTTDKDGFIPSLLASEITGRTGKDPGTIYHELTTMLGEPWYDRIDAPATPEEKARISRLSAESITATTLAGDAITAVRSDAPGNHAPIGGVKVETAAGWFAARPSGTENIYKIYAESFHGQQHLASILAEAQSIVSAALRESGSAPAGPRRSATSPASAKRPRTRRAASRKR